LNTAVGRSATVSGPLTAYNAAPQAEQKREPTGLVWRQRKQASSVPGCGAGGMLTVTLHGWPHPGIAMPSIAAIPAAWMALNSLTRPGMKKHSTKPRNPGIPVQKKQQ
jgi:hypothetical protein